MAERSRDWFRQALHDLAHARNAAGTGYHDWACFAAQQAAEKALKALAGHLGGEAWGHSLLALVTGLATTDPETVSLREAAIRLDRYDIPTRYPNGFDEGAPLTALVAGRAGVCEVWLFGSLARGNATPRSDADLLIVLDQDARRPMDRIPEFLLLLEGLGRPTDVLVLTAAEWKVREGTALHREVVTRGIPLYPPS